MKKNLILIAVLLSFGSSTKLLACDMCGCSTMGGLNNLSSYATNNFIVFKSAYNAFHTFSETEGSLVTSDMYTLDLVGGYSLNDRLHLSGYIPFKVNNYSSGETETKIRGLGDIGIVANYILFKSNDTILGNQQYNFSVKGGIEFPTGKFNKNFRTDHLPASVSAGSGSIDLITGARFVLYKGYTNYLADYTFKYNFENASMYRFGMQNSLALIVTHKLQKGKSEFILFGGLIGEHASFDKFHNIDQHATSGENLYLDLGCEFVRKKIFAGISSDIPLYSDFGGEISSKPRYSLSFGYLFN